MKNKEIAEKVKELYVNNAGDIVEMVKQSPNPKEAAKAISKAYNAKPCVVKAMLSINILGVRPKTPINKVLKQIYNSISGEKAFCKICKERKLNIIKTSLFTEKDYKNIYPNPKFIYEIIDNKYKYMRYNERQKKLDSVYFQAFKNI